MSRRRERFESELSSEELTPEEQFDRRWALTVVACGLKRLEDEYASRGNAELFQMLKPTLVGDSAQLPYAEIAGALEMDLGTVKVSAHRLRKRFRRAIRREIEHTVSDEGEMEAELEYLRQILGGR